MEWLTVGDGIKTAEFIEDNDGRDACNESILDEKAPSSFIRLKNQCNGVEKKKYGITKKGDGRESANDPIHDGEDGKGEGDALVNMGEYVGDYKREVSPRLDNKKPMFATKKV